MTMHPSKQDIVASYRYFVKHEVRHKKPPEIYLCDERIAGEGDTEANRARERAKVVPQKRER